MSTVRCLLMFSLISSIFTQKQSVFLNLRVLMLCQVWYTGCMCCSLYLFETWSLIGLELANLLDWQFSELRGPLVWCSEREWPP